MMDKETELLEKMGFPEILKEIPGTVLGHDIDRFTEKQYEKSMDAYVNEYRHIFEKLEVISMAKPDLRNYVIEKASGTLVDAIREALESTKKHWWNDKRALQQDTYKMVIVGYLTPAVLSMKFRISEEFCEKLQEVWMREFPGSSYEIVTVDNIASGFGYQWFKKRK